MPRRPRRSQADVVYHVLNRAHGRATLFASDADYEAFERVILDARARHPMRILAYCVMPSHWHMVLWPCAEGQLSEFVGWLSATHARRWRKSHDTTGTGYVYQNRFKSFAVESDEHLLTVCRYVERNALAAGLVRAAEDWRWSSLWRRVRHGKDALTLLARWPIRPSSLEEWLALVNQPQTEKELASLRRSIERGAPFGSKEWCACMG
jgi:putative transposase